MDLMATEEGIITAMATTIITTTEIITMGSVTMGITTESCLNPLAASYFCSAARLWA